MAQSTQRVVHEADAGVNVDTPAWLHSAATRKYRVEGGQVWSGGGGMLFPLPALPGFGSLPEAIRPLVFQAVAQYVTNRVGQTAEGNVAEAVAKAMTLGEIPGVRDNDAFEALYLAEIEGRLSKRYPNMADDKSDEGKLRFRTAIAATAEKYRGGLFDSVIEAAKANSVRPLRERKRAPAKAKADAAMDLDD